MLLVELLIAMGLTMVILSMMLMFYDQIDRANSALEKEQNRSFKKLYLSTRLAAVMPKAISASDPDGDFFFFTTTSNDSFAKPGTPSLLFAFDNGVKLDQQFSNHVIGRLYVNKNDQFCLAIWPSPVRWNSSAPTPMKNEVLYDNVEDLSFEFYAPPAKDRRLILANTKPKILQKEQLLLEIDGTWKEEWQQEYKDLPALVKIHLTINSPQEKEELLLAYPLPMSHLIILYDRS